MMSGGYMSGGYRYNRPRRPNPDTLSYLRALPLDIRISQQEISSFLSSATQDYPQGMSAALSAIDEIRNEVASIAGDEFGSQCLELLASIALPYSEVAARTLLYGLSGYHLHLATHRYGSHVVQTVLQLSINASIESDMSSHRDSPKISGHDELPSLRDLILGVVEELLPFTTQLAVHITGSHVLRSLLCVLGGVELIQSQRNCENALMEGGAIRRGKAKRKKKSPAIHDTPSHAGAMRVVHLESARLDYSCEGPFAPALESMTESLSQAESLKDGPGELQQMASHASAGPLLIILLRVLTHSFNSTKSNQSLDADIDRSIMEKRLGILSVEPRFEMDSPAHHFVNRLLCWDSNVAASKQKYAGDIIYGLSGEPRGSHLLETMLRTCHDEMYASLLQCGDFFTPKSMNDYVEHDVSNFVVQTVLCTVRQRTQAEILLRSLDRLIANGSILDASKNRRSILWRAVEMSAKYRVAQDTLMKSIRMGFVMLARKGDAAEENNEEGRKKRQRKKASSISIQKCVRLLIDLKAPETEMGRVTVDVAGARTIHHLLRFVPRLCLDVLDGLVHGMAKGELELIIKDGLASRCVMDGILGGPMNDPVFGKAANDILTKLSGSWVALSMERVGHHTVKKLFHALPEMESKAILAAELAHGLHRLSGNSMGRSVLEECCVHEFIEGEQAWRAAVTKRQEREEWLMDIIGRAERQGKKAKRKRKRNNAEPSDKLERDQSREHRTSNVESFVNSLVVPK